jgi:hypothetical protein
MRYAYILVGNTERKRPHRRSRRGWKDNIRMVIREIRWDGVDWMHLGQDRDQWRALLNTVMNFRSIQGGEFFD